MGSRSLSLTVVVLFEGAVGGSLERWRQLYDPLGADRMPSHLTLVAPFPTEPPLLLGLERHIWAVCHASPPLRLGLGDVARDNGLIYVDVAAGGPELARLRDALHTGPLAGQAGPFRPRVVVAEPAGERDLALASRQLPGLAVRESYQVDRLHLMATHADGSWYVRDFFTLDGTYAVRPAGRTGSVESPRGAG